MMMNSFNKDELILKVIELQTKIEELGKTISVCAKHLTQDEIDWRLHLEKRKEREEQRKNNREWHDEQYMKKYGNTLNENKDKEDEKKTDCNKDNIDTTLDEQIQQSH